MSGTLKWVNFLAFLAMIVINILANVLKFGGHTTGQAADNYPNLFTPAPFTFAIWCVIYIFMGIYTISQIVKMGTYESLLRVDSAIGILFLLSCIFNVLWIFSWHNLRFGLSLLWMLLLLVSLIIINLRLRIVPGVSVSERLTVYGFNIYLGWIAVATIANISVLLVKIGWSGFGLSSVIWTLIALATGTILGICFIMVGRRYFAACAIIWAFIGILVKHISSTNPDRSPAIAIGAVAGIAVILAFMIVSAINLSLQDNYSR